MNQMSKKVSHKNENIDPGNPATRRTEEQVPLHAVDVVFLLFLAVIAYVGGFILIARSQFTFPWRLIHLGWTFLIIVSWNVLWIILVKSLKLKNRQNKVALILLGFVLSAIVLTDSYIVYMFQNMW